VLLVHLLVTHLNELEENKKKQKKTENYPRELGTPHNKLYTTVSANSAVSRFLCQFRIGFPHIPTLKTRNK
jgi:hypothetical protein